MLPTVRRAGNNIGEKESERQRDRERERIERENRIKEENKNKIGRKIKRIGFSQKKRCENNCRIGCGSIGAVI